MSDFLMIIGGFGFFLAILLFIVRLLNKKRKLGKLALYCLLIGIICLIIDSIVYPSSEESITKTANKAEESELIESSEEPIEKVIDATPPSFPQYRIIEIGDVSFVGAKRYTIDVVVENKVTTEQLQSLASEIKDQIQEDSDFQALAIYFYDYEEFIGSGATLGRVEFAPYGDWSKAQDVKLGNYNSFEFKYYLNEKDWSKQLTYKEAEIVGYTNYLTYDVMSEASDDEINSKVSEKYNITKEDVDSIYRKYMVWTFD